MSLLRYFQRQPSLPTQGDPEDEYHRIGMLCEVQVMRFQTASIMRFFIYAIMDCYSYIIQSLVARSPIPVCCGIMFSNLMYVTCSLWTFLNCPHAAFCNLIGARKFLNRDMPVVHDSPDPFSQGVHRRIWERDYLLPSSKPYQYWKGCLHNMPLGVQGRTVPKS